MPRFLYLFQIRKILGKTNFISNTIQMEDFLRCIQKISACIYALKTLPESNWGSHFVRREKISFHRGEYLITSCIKLKVTKILTHFMSNNLKYLSEKLERMKCAWFNSHRYNAGWIFNLNLQSKSLQRITRRINFASWYIINI